MSSTEVDDSEELTKFLEEEDAREVAQPTPPPKAHADESPVEASTDPHPILAGRHQQWSTSDDKVFLPIHQTRAVLTPGYYEIGCHPERGIYFHKMPVITEALLRFPDSISLKVIEEIENFWQREALYHKYGLAYKRGIILYGPPGGGKSCTVQLVCEDVIKRNGIVIQFYRPDPFKAGMAILREIQPDVPIVVMMEDIDEILEQCNQSLILNILDGVDRVHKAVFLATTNYPEKLGARIINRPSRFDRRYKIPMPSPVARRMYLEHLVSLNGEDQIDVGQWVDDMNELSLAHLKDLFVSVAILGEDYETTVKILHSMRERVTSEHDITRSVGFAANPTAIHGGGGGP